MSLTLVTGPTAEPLTIEEVKQHLRVDSADEDALIHSIMRAVREQLDGRDGWLGRSLMTQTWDMKLDAFPCNNGPIKLMLPPVQSVSSITYVDSEGSSQTLSSSAYVLGSDVVWQPRVHLAYGETWPSTRAQPDAVTVRFVTGYGNQNAVPQPIRHAMLLMIEHYFENRGTIVMGSVASLPQNYEFLLAPYRVMGFGR